MIETCSKAVLCKRPASLSSCLFIILRCSLHRKAPHTVIYIATVSISLAPAVVTVPIVEFVCRRSVDVNTVVRSIQKDCSPGVGAAVVDIYAVVLMVKDTRVVGLRVVAFGVSDFPVDAHIWMSPSTFPASSKIFSLIDEASRGVAAEQFGHAEAMPPDRDVFGRESQGITCGAVATRLFLAGLEEAKCEIEAARC